jgi:hypothetical protein
MRKIYTVNDRTYTRFYAWLPQRMRSGALVWLEYYYMRPDANGQGLLLAHSEYLLEVSRTL